MLSQRFVVQGSDNIHVAATVVVKLHVDRIEFRRINGRANVLVGEWTLRSSSNDISVEV